MRKVGLLFLILIATTATTPAIIGYLVKQQHTQLISAINKSYPNLKIVLAQYQMGFRQSNVEWQVSFTNPISNKVKIFPVHETITHGPILPSGVGFASIQSSGTLVSFDTFIQFDGIWKSHFTVPKTQIPYSNTQLTWEGAKGDLEFKLSSTRIIQASSNATIGTTSLTMHQPSAATLTIQPYTVNYHAKNFTGNLINGATISTPINFSLQANNINPKSLLDLYQFIQNTDFSQKISDDMTIQFLTLATNAFQANDTQLAGNNVTLNGSITIPQTAFAEVNPQSILKSTQIKIDARAAVALVNMLAQDYFKTSKKDAPLSAISSASPEDTEKASAFNKKIAELMQQGKLPLSVAIQVMDIRNTHLPEEEFQKKMLELKLTDAMATQITQWYSETNSTPNTENSTAENTALNAINQWIQKGYLVQSNNDYIFQITYNRGEIKINDKTLPQEASLPVAMTP